MDIALYKIPGISLTDTPQFANEIDQRDYFDNSVDSTHVITEAFYPPFYTNFIDLDIDDVNFSTNYNYLSLTYDNKRYYYFITDVQYVSESVIRLFISLDSIQTFMFNLSFIESHVTRRSIKRWNDNAINRNYLRESFTEGKFKLISKDYYSSSKGFDEHAEDENITGVIVIKTPGTNLPFLDDIYINSYEFNDKESFSQLATRFYFVINGKIPDSIKISPAITHAGTTIDTIQYRKGLGRELQENATIIYAYYLPLSCLDGIKITYDTVANKYLITYDGDEYDVNITYDSGGVGPFEGILTPKPGYIVNTLSRLQGINFIKSNSVRSFDYHLVPALFDETYIKIDFGEGNTRSTFPLHQCLYPEIIFNYYADYLSGKRTYWISTTESIAVQTGDDNIEDLFDTAVTASSLSLLDISTDAFKEYYTYNKGGAIAGIASTVASVAALVAMLL